MTGDRCLDIIRQYNRDIKSILITGYGLDESSISAPNVYIIHKPFNTQSITEEVRAILDKQ
ncbi:MAG: response regulator, partial [Planctomycetota bacterium]